jgi:hypothetical protein
VDCVDIDVDVDVDVDVDGDTDGSGVVVVVCGVDDGDTSVDVEADASEDGVASDIGGGGPGGRGGLEDTPGGVVDSVVVGRGCLVDPPEGLAISAAETSAGVREIWRDALDGLAVGSCVEVVGLRDDGKVVSGECEAIQKQWLSESKEDAKQNFIVNCKSTGKRLQSDW